MFQVAAPLPMRRRLLVPFDRHVAEGDAPRVAALGGTGGLAGEATGVPNEYFDRAGKLMRE